MNNKYNLRSLQLKLLGNLIVLDKFLKENGIKYYLVGGSTLGAVRHGGFIPWDDDIDIGMDREDFERFEKLDFSKLESQRLQYCPIGKNVFLNAPIGFLYDRSDESIPHRECPTIDIFPIDNVPKSKFKQKLQKFYSYIYHISIGRTPAKNRGTAARIYTSLIVWLTPGFMFNVYEKFSKRSILRLGRKNSLLVANIFGQQGYNREIMPRKYIEEVIDMDFEGHLFPVQKNYHEYLTHVYGDYMRLPSGELQKPHHNKLGEGESPEEEINSPI